jgi:hypothetical protein
LKLCSQKESIIHAAKFRFRALRNLVLEIHPRELGHHAYKTLGKCLEIGEVLRWDGDVVTGRLEVKIDHGLAMISIAFPLTFIFIDRVLLTKTNRGSSSDFGVGEVVGIAREIAIELAVAVL